MTGQIAVIGLGHLGTALARRLLAAEYQVIGYDLDLAARSRLADLDGLTIDAMAYHDMPELLHWPILLCCLPTTADVEEVLEHVEPPAGTLVIDTTTGDPDATAALGARLAERGVRYTDCTVLGSSAQAAEGDVVAMIGGEEADVDEAMAVVRTFARQWYHLGPVGSGARMKLVANLVLGLNRAALAEGLAFAASQGMDPAATLAVLRSGAAYSKVMDTKGEKMVQGDFAPQAKLSQHRKDVSQILAVGERTAAELPLTLAHSALLDQVIARGYGDVDNSAIIAAYQAGSPRPTS